MRAMRRLPALVLSACALAAVPAAARPSAPADEVTVYRCTDARGKVQLRDSPCPGGQRQSTRRMQRIVDPPPVPRPPEPPPPVTAVPSPEPPRVLVVQAPRPMYECTTPDGTTYTSESPEGNPRWVPLWTLDYPVLAERDVHRPGGARIRYGDGRVDARVRPGGVERRVVPTVAAYGNAGSWIRDSCHALPQRETCDRLRDRRDELRRRAFNAQPSERARLDVEERGINARLSSDCGGT